MKIYFLLATQHDNLGDLLINKMLIDEVSKYGTVYVDAAGLPASFKEAVITNEIKDFEKEYGGSLKRPSGYKLLSAVRTNFDYYFKSPGPSGGIGYDFKSILTTTVLAFQFNYLSKGKIKLNLVGNDIIIQTKLDKWFQKNTNRAFKNYLVRSVENRDQLIEMGYKNTSFIPDVAFIYDNKGVKIIKNNVYISFRNLKDDNYKDKIITILRETIPFYKQQGLKVEFFFQVESDYEFNHFLFKIFQSEGIHFKSTCLRFDEISYFNKAKYVLTNRLHVMILGIVHEAIPVLILNDDQKTAKINRVVKDNKLDNLIIDSFESLKIINTKYEGIAVEIAQIKNHNKLLITNKIKELFTLV
jgi:hypothetical protein